MYFLDLIFIFQLKLKLRIASDLHRFARACSPTFLPTNPDRISRSQLINFDEFGFTFAPFPSHALHVSSAHRLLIPAAMAEPPSDNIYLPPLEPCLKGDGVLLCVPIYMPTYMFMFMFMFMFIFMFMSIGDNGEEGGAC